MNINGIMATYLKHEFALRKYLKKMRKQFINIIEELKRTRSLWKIYQDYVINTPKMIKQLKRNTRN